MLQPDPADAGSTSLAAAPLIRVEGLSKRFGALAALADVTLDLAPGEFVCLLGPSGCGKSTLLRVIAGFETPDVGRVLFEGGDLAGVPPHRRPLNMMFQSYALFPHMSVAGNVAYGLRQAGIGRAERAARVAEMLGLVRLEGFDDRRPDRLSGGQRQRVALARALARRPRSLLLDEPLAALDRGLREETQEQLRALQKRLGTTFVVVTHDPGEAMTMADRIGVMDRGHLVQVGRPVEVYERPATRYTAGLLGDVNLVEGALASVEPDGLGAVASPHGVLRGVPGPGTRVGDRVVLAVRPERLRPVGEGANRIAGTLAATTFLGDRLRVSIEAADGRELRATLPAGSPVPEPGTPFAVAFDPHAASILPA